MYSFTYFILFSSLSFYSFILTLPTLSSIPSSYSFFYCCFFHSFLEVNLKCGDWVGYYGTRNKHSRYFLSLIYHLHPHQHFVNPYISIYKLLITFLYNINLSSTFDKRCIINVLYIQSLLLHSFIDSAYYLPV